MPVLGSAVYRFIGDTTSLTRAFARARGQAAATNKSISKSLASTGANMQKLGMSMTKMVTLPIVGVGAAATKMSLDFEKSMTDIRALVGASDKQMRDYEHGIMRLAGTVTAAPKELADALYFVTSSGFSGAKALKVLDASAKAAAAGLGTVQDVADPVTSVVNAYGESAISAQRATDIMLAAIREGKAEPVEFAGAIGRVIAPAEAMGVSFDEVSAAVAGLTLGGLDAAEAVTALRGVISTVMNPTQQGVDVLKTMGMTTEELQAAMERDFMGTLMMLRKELGNNKTAMGDLFGNVRALNGFLALTGRNADKNAAIFRELAKAGGDTSKAFGQAMQDPMNRLRRTWSQLSESLIDVGNMIVPFVVTLAEKVRGLLESFSGLSDRTKQVILVIGGLAAAVGPALVVLGSLALVISALSAPILAVAGAVASVGALLGILGPQVADSFKGIKEDVGSEIAAMTNETAGKVYDMSDEIETDLLRLSLNSDRLTKGMADKVIANSQRMRDIAISASEKQYKKSLQNIQWLRDKAGVISYEQADEMVKNSKKTRDKSIARSKEMADRVAEQIDRLRDKGVRITDDMRARIVNNMRKQRDQVLAVVVENQAKQTALFERLRAETGRITQQQAAKLIASADNTRDKNIEAARKRYEKVVELAIYERDVTGTLSKAEAKEVIANAKLQRDETIKYANDQYKGVVGKVRRLRGDVGDIINTATGEWLNTWQRLGKGLEGFWSRLAKTIMGYVHGLINSLIDAWNWIMDKLPGDHTPIPHVGGGSDGGRGAPNFSRRSSGTRARSRRRGGRGAAAGGHLAKGTADWKGGTAIVGEKGPELVYLPQHATVIPNDMLKKLPGFAKGLNVPQARDIVHVGRLMQRMGYLVGEHPAFGGVAPVHTAGSYHYSGQAIDVNWLPAAEEPSKLDRLANWIRANVSPITELLWRAPNHYDHLHLAMAGTGGGAIGNLLGAIGGRIAGWLGKGADWVVDNALKRLGVNAPQMDGVFGDITGRMFEGARDQMIRGVKDALGNIGGLFGGGAVSTGAAVNIGRQLAASMFGWTGGQFNALNTLWTRESGWRWNADNPTSSAYGIPQALPGSKMASAGADWRTNPATQIRWGLQYINQRYGSPMAALAHSNAMGWYKDGALFTRPTIAGFGEGGPEAAVPLRSRKTRKLFSDALLDAAGGNVHNSIGGRSDNDNYLTDINVTVMMDSDVVTRAQRKRETLRRRR